MITHVQITLTLEEMMNSKDRIEIVALAKKTKPKTKENEYVHSGQNLV